MPKKKTRSKPTTFKIRGHHLLCLQGFQGYGYNPEFVENFHKLLEHVSQNPQDVIFELCTDIDAICTPCTHHKANKCQKDAGSQQRFQAMDKVLLKKLNLKNGHRASAQELIQLSNQVLKHQNDVQGICDHCEWHGKCLWYQKLDKHPN